MARRSTSGAVPGTWHASWSAAGSTCSASTSLQSRFGIEEIQERFADSARWALREVREARFHSRVAPPVPAVAACVERV
jgi:hypothetical protein